MSITTPTQAILAAINTRYAASAGDAIRAAGCTGVHYGRAPQSAAYPFIVFNIPATISEPTVGQGTSAGAIYDDITIDVTVYDDRRSPNRAMEILGNWHAAFNFVTLNLASPYKQIIGKKDIDCLPIENPDQKGWQCVSTYEYNIAE